MKKLLNLVAAVLISLLLLGCGSEPHTPLREIYEAATAGDTTAQHRLYNSTGIEAGKFQEMLADDIAYSSPYEAEKWWARAKQNGVQNGGPNFYLLFWLRKYWYLVVAIAIGLIILKLKCGSKKEPASGNVLIIDTNVWMDDRLRPWFGRLEKQAKKNGWVILLESIVLGELKGLSKNEEKRKIAQLGMSRIERLQNELGKQFRMENNATAQDTIADTVLLKTAARISDSMLITNDKELRILARSKGINAFGSAECKF
ncbi:MAG: hypothetical protein IKZ07_03095 [Akkermansia sp.]|nr:hypothetical protein [Akkermansia sp.]